VRDHIAPVAIAAAIALFVPRPAIAQPAGGLPLSQILPDLIGNTIVLAPRSTPEVPSHAAHFKPSPEQLQTPEQFNQQMVSQLSTFPFGSSSGGFTYTYDPALGTFSRSSESFGPLFAERALTIGRERSSLGVAYQRSTYDTFEGKNLRQREINFYIQHTDCCGRTQSGTQVSDGTLLNPAFEGDLIEAALSLELTTDTVVFSATYGLTDRLDLGVAVPLVSVDMSASIRARIQRLATAANPDGSIVVGRVCVPSAGRVGDQSAWIWKAQGGLTCLPPPKRLVSPGPPIIIEAAATSDDGQVIGGSQSVGGSADSNAVIWVGGQPAYLKEFLQANGLPNAFRTWINTGTITGMSPDGRVLVGWGAAVGGFRGYMVILGSGRVIPS